MAEDGRELQRTVENGKKWQRELQRTAETGRDWQRTRTNARRAYDAHLTHLASALYMSPFDFLLICSHKYGLSLSPCAQYAGQVARRYITAQKIRKKFETFERLKKK